MLRIRKLAPRLRGPRQLRPFDRIAMGARGSPRGFLADFTWLSGWASWHTINLPESLLPGQLIIPVPKPAHPRSTPQKAPRYEIQHPVAA